MNKSEIPLVRPTEQYLITCRSEGKILSTLRGYSEKLGRFIRWCEEACLADFSVELVREYIVYLQSAPKYENHPFHQSQGAHMSAANVRNHVRVLRSFSSWLCRGSFTEENVLSKLKVPKAPLKMLGTLSDEEIRRLFDGLDQDTSASCRDAAMLLLLLDTGLRCAEILHLWTEDVHLGGQWVKVMGKGQKERIVPLGSSASKLLQRYLYYLRPEPLGDDRFSWALMVLK